MKIILFAALAPATFALAGCSESTSTGESTLPPPASVVVSNVHAPIANVANAAGAAVVEAANVAYVAAAPGTWPGSTAASVRNVTRNGSAIDVDVRAGGFDPIAIDAGQDDKIVLTITMADGSHSVFSLTVPPRRPPIVVRTYPSKGRIDVALNVQIDVVFSEPIQQATISGTSVTLLKDGSPVQGAVRLSPDGLTLSFTPENSLAPQSSYTLVGGGIRDLDDDALSDPVLTTFTTTLPTQFPPLPVGASRTFVFQHQLSYPVRGYTTESRFILYDDRTFVLRFDGLDLNYRGRYSESNGAIVFDWDGWSTAGDWGATGTLIGDTLSVRYNIIMALSDFEDAVYVLNK